MTVNVESNFVIVAAVHPAKVVLVVLAHVLVLALYGCESEPSRSDGQRPSVLLVVADTLRRDHLGAYASTIGASPRIDAFAASAVVFENAYAQSPSTKPSIASLFTSLLPSQHGTIHNYHALASRFVTLAEVFKASGFETAGFTENPIITAEFDFDQGFDEYTLYPERHAGSHSASEEFDKAVHDWLGKNSQHPFFLYVHYADPHSPYWAPPAYRGRFAKTPGPAGKGLNVNSSSVEDIGEAIAKYDEEISYIDDRFGGLLDRLQELDIDDKTIIVFLSDHGEAFGEHGNFHHSHSVYSELIDIPLIISANAKMRAGRRTEATQHIDILPTLLDLAGIAPSDSDLEASMQVQGQSLVDSNRTNLDGRRIISEHLREGWGKRMRSVVSGEYKLIEDLDAGLFQLFSVETNPGDRTGLDAHAPREVRKQLVSVLGGFHKAVADAPEIEIDPKVQSQLRRLGYVDHDEAPVHPGD